MCLLDTIRTRTHQLCIGVTSKLHKIGRSGLSVYKIIISWYNIYIRARHWCAKWNQLATCSEPVGALKGRPFCSLSFTKKRQLKPAQKNWQHYFIILRIRSITFLINFLVCLLDTTMSKMESARYLFRTGWGA
jgi:hypothetical protein